MDAEVVKEFKRQQENFNENQQNMDEAFKEKFERMQGIIDELTLAIIETEVE